MADGGPSPRPALSSVLFEVTERCNLGCRYCYNVYKRPGGAPPARGSYTRARAVLERLFAVADVERVTMSGGEPFLAERFMDLVRFCFAEGKRLIITSNGNGGSDDEYRELVELGLTNIVMPFHSIRAEEHDAMTGRDGSQRRSLESLELVRALGGRATPIVVITRLNHASLAETVLFLKRRGFRRMIINRFNYGGRGIREAGRLALTVTELRRAYEVVNELAVRCGLWVSANICTPHCVLDPTDYPRIGFGACDIEMDGRPFTMDTDGDVRFCNHSPVVMGNIFADDLRAMLATDYARTWERAVPEQCADCGRWEACVGGCRAAAEQLGCDQTEVDPIAWSATSRRSLGLLKYRLQ